MISDQDRQIAEETFGLIERSEASGNSFEANLPIGAPDPASPDDVVSALADYATSHDAINAQAAQLRADRAACPHPVDEDGECGHSSCDTAFNESDQPYRPAVATSLDDLDNPAPKICPAHGEYWGCWTECPTCTEVLSAPAGGPVSMALAEHTAPALDVIEQAANPCTCYTHDDRAHYPGCATFDGRSF